MMPKIPPANSAHARERTAPFKLGWKAVKGNSDFRKRVYRASIIIVSS